MDGPKFQWLVLRLLVLILRVVCECMNNPRTDLLIEAEALRREAEGR